MHARYLGCPLQGRFTVFAQFVERQFYESTCDYLLLNLGEVMFLLREKTTRLYFCGRVIPSGSSLMVGIDKKK